MIARLSIARRYESSLAALRSPITLAIVITCLAGAFAMYVAASGTPGGQYVALAIALSPALAALAWSMPLVFPYGAYAMLVPFDLLLSVPQLGTVARLCGAAAGLALVIWIVRRRQIVLPGAALAAWGGFVAWSALSTLWSINPTDALRETGTMMQLALLFAIASLIPATLRDCRAVISAVVLGGLAAAYLGIHELAHLSVAQQVLSQVSDRIPLLIGNQKLDINEFADSLLLPMGLLTVATVRTSNLVLKGAGLGAMCVLLYAMSLAASREAFVAVGLMFVYFLIVLPQRWQIGGLAAVLTILAGANGNLLHRFVIASDSGGSGRTSIWSAGAAAFKQHWLVGAGSGSFASAYNTVYLRVFQVHDMGWSRAAHNMLVENGVEYGVIGLGLLVAALALTFFAVPKVATTHPLFGMRAGLTGALIGLCVAGFFVDLTTAKTLWLALTLSGILRACALTERPANAKANANAPAAEPEPFATQERPAFVTEISEPFAVPA